MCDRDGCDGAVTPTGETASQWVTDIPPVRPHVTRYDLGCGRCQACGNTGCRCRADPPRLHGPYWVWTRSINGKTITRSISDEQAERYRPWFDNTQRLRQLTEQLKQLALEQAQTDHNWPTS